MERFPSATNKGEKIPIDADALNQEQGTVHAIEHTFKQVSWNEELLTRWLKLFYRLDVAIKENPEGTLNIGVDAMPNGIPDLPAGYGVKGGGARAVLRSVLKIEAEPPRDIDLVYVGKNEQDTEMSRKLAETYMPDDFASGYGVETLEKDYFLSRDFTWNEVLYVDGHIVCTKQCLLDTVRNVVRVSDYEKRESYSGQAFYVKPKLLAKAVRFVAAARAHGNNKMALSEETDRAVEMGIDYWHIALHLNRSFEQSEAVAEEYVDALIARELLPSTIQSPVEALHYLSEETDFIFRAEAAEVLDREIRLAKELDLEKEITDEETYETYAQYSNVTPFWRAAK
ncbi:MAG: hypothetical protein WC030_00210 [Candidatus Paceibacterota bacterium]